MKYSPLKKLSPKWTNTSQTTGASPSSSLRANSLMESLKISSNRVASKMEQCCLLDNDNWLHLLINDWSLERGNAVGTDSETNPWRMHSAGEEEDTLEERTDRSSGFINRLSNKPRTRNNHLRSHQTNFPLWNKQKGLIWVNQGHSHYWRIQQFGNCTTKVWVLC